MKKSEPRRRYVSIELNVIGEFYNLDEFKKNLKRLLIAFYDPEYDGDIEINITEYSGDKYNETPDTT